MAISSRRLYQAALALLVTSETLLTSVNASVYVCGKDYNDASINCTVNPSCPSGDGCPGDKSICFALPDNQCFSPPSPPPTPKPPTNSPTPSPFRTCGSDYNDALSNCRSNAQCPSGDGCGVGTACFTIPASECPTDAPTEAPTPTPKVCGVDALDAQAHCLIYSQRCPSGEGCGIGEACFNVPDYLCGVTQKPTDKPTNEPTPEPTPKVCGSNELNAQAHCLDMSKRCPSGNGCGQGEACFTVQKNVCGLVEDPEESAGATDVTVEPTVSQTTESFFKVCGDGYADAAQNCRTNAKCPSGDGCENGATCFALPPATCSESVPVTTPNPTPMQAITNTPRPTPKPTTPEPTTMNPTAYPSENPTANPSEDPTAMKLPMVPTVPPIPERLFICGDDYTDASQNFCTNPTCPTGGGCASGAVCYALPYAKCSEEATTGGGFTNNDAEDVNDEEGEPTSSPSHSPYPTVSPSTNPSSTPSYSPTNYPTQSPIFNTYFCGATYKLAEENCWTAQRCPSGSGCSKEGENCYPISLPRCLSAAPTDAPTGPGPRPSASPTVSPAPSVSPTVSTSPTNSPSGIPTKAPVVNTNFCGNTYSEAAENCAEATPCPNEICPGGLMCFVGIPCAATVPFLPNLTPGQPTDSSDDSTSTAPTPSQPSTPRPTMNWLESIGISGSMQTSSQPTPTNNERFCGMNFEHAQNRCAIAIPCPDGSTNVCPTDQTCFQIGGPCAASTVFPPTPNTPPAPLPTPSPSTSPTGKHVFDPDATSFCGVDYNDAQDNCYANKACPSGAIEVCPSGQTCYPGIMFCETPPPTLSVVPTNFVAVEGTPTTTTSTSLPTKKPTSQPQISPDWTWDDGTADSGSGSCMPGLILRSLVMGGVILGALVI